jgi:cytidylate kinase
VRDELAARDHQDSTRAVAPLRCADDAVRLDSTGLAVDEVVARIVALANDRRGR